MITLVNPMPALPDGRVARITSGFGPRSGGMYSMHYGADMLFPRVEGEPTTKPQSDGKWIVPNGIPVLAAADGIVSKSSWTGTGDRIRIDHSDGWATGYMHLRDRRVQVGDSVTAGQPIATISNSPWCRGCAPAAPPPAAPPNIGLNHLHFELYKDSTAVNPAEALTTAQILPMPSSWLWPVIFAAGIGYVLYRYVF